MDSNVNWLLEEENPEIRYRVLTELLGKSKQEQEVKDAYKRLLTSQSLQAIMDKFNQNDKWEDVNALMALAELGLTKDDVEIDAYVERIIKKLNRSMKCARILLLRNLVQLGYYEHPWVNEEIKKAQCNIRQDGTVRCLDNGKKRNDSRLPDMGCYRQTTTYLLLAAELKKQGIYFEEFDAVIDFYLRHHVMFHEGEMEKVIIPEMTETFYPIDHVHIGLQVILYGLSVLGVGSHENCKQAWEQMNCYRDKQGNYILADSFDTPYMQVGKIGEANKWVTLYVKLAEKYCQQYRR